MEERYITLILEKCVKFKRGKRVFIAYNSYNEEFVNNLVEALKKKGAKDIYLKCTDPHYEHELLQNLSENEILEGKYFDDSIYNEYAKKRAAFIIIDSPIPGLFNDIDDDKLALISRIKSDTKQYFRIKETSNKISWTIIPAYNREWEKSLKINNLAELLNSICMLEGNPVLNWNNYITKLKKVSEILNDYQFDYLRYENDKGTNLIVGLPEDYKFESVADDKVLVNMPSYEVFTSPNKFKTEGRVYNTIPLYYNGGVIDDFYIDFKGGKAVDCHAKKGEKLLRSIIEYDEGSCFLGEVALVECDSPIAKTKVTYKMTLLDENASCHLALGQGFGSGSKKSLEKRGVNFSKTHVDFMIGDNTLNITGIKNGTKVPIMKSGKFVI